MPKELISETLSGSKGSREHTHTLSEEAISGEQTESWLTSKVKAAHFQKCYYSRNWEEEVTKDYLLQAKQTMNKIVVLVFFFTSFSLSSFYFSD